MTVANALPRQHWRFGWTQKSVVVALLILGTLAVDTTLPTAGSMAKELSCSGPCAQQGLSIFFVGFALGQFLFGPLSDVVGRRLSISLGLGFFAFASAMLATITEPNYLLPLRFAQALGAGAGPVLGRALVRDLVTGEDPTKQLAEVSIFAGLAPIVAVPIGGALAIYADWRTAFYIQTIISLSVLLAAICILPRPANSPKEFIAALPRFPSTLAHILVQPWLYVIALGWSANLVFIANSPSLFGIIGISEPSTYALLYALVVTGIAIGAYLVRRLVSIYSNELIVKRFAILFLLSAGGVAYSLHVLNLYLFMFFAFTMLVGIGSFIPSSIGLLLAKNHEFAGTRSSVLGLVQYSVGAAVLYISSVASDQPVAASYSILIISFITLMIAFVGRRVAKK